MRSFINGINNGGQRLTGVGTPTAITDGVPKGFIRYDLSSFAQGQPAASEVLMDFVSPLAFSIPINMVGSVAQVSTAPANAATFTLTKNGTSVGTVNFAAGATTGTFTAASLIAVAANDRLQLIAPATQDSALASLAFTLVGLR